MVYDFVGAPAMKFCFLKLFLLILFSLFSVYIILSLINKIYSRQGREIQILNCFTNNLPKVFIDGEIWYKQFSFYYFLLTFLLKYFFNIV